MSQEWDAFCIDEAWLGLQRQESELTLSSPGNKPLRPAPATLSKFIMESVAGFAPMAEITAGRMKEVHEREGYHVIYDVPVMHLSEDALLPGRIVVGMEASFLFYCENPESLYCIAVGSNLSQGKDARFVGQGFYKTKDKKANQYKVVNPKEHVEDADQYKFWYPQQTQYFWAEIKFTERTKCQFYIYLRHMGTLDTTVDVTTFDRMTIGNTLGANNCRLMQVHFTCPKGRGHEFFEKGTDRWLTSTQIAPLLNGGRLVVTGRYKKTKDSDPRITVRLAADQNEAGELHAVGPKTFTTANLVLVFAIRGTNVQCSVDDTWYTLKRNWPTGVHALFVRVTDNFVVDNVEVSSGMIQWQTS